MFVQIVVMLGAALLMQPQVPVQIPTRPTPVPVHLQPASPITQRSLVPLARAFAADRPVVLDVRTDIEAMAPRAWTGERDAPLRPGTTY